MALTGAAPIGRDVSSSSTPAVCSVLEGYGLTETCAASTLNTRREPRSEPSDGRCRAPGFTIAADGELLLRGPHVFAGYYRNEEATSEALVGGWLCTGDLGFVDDDGFVAITGRKKDLIITSSGKNITPTNIEDALRESRWISQAVVFGDNRPYLVALLTLDADEAAGARRACGGRRGRPRRARGRPARSAPSCSGPRSTQVNERFARIEQIKRFAILDHDLSQAAGELTPTLKIKRGVVAERYGDRVKELYS